MDPGEAYQLDELAAMAGTDPVKLLRLLGEMEVAGLISAGNGRYVRRDR
jgi:hypothetical protein